jgi:ElaB/YqjD/DUF883 family membrane-anchored ribosome-binding protein
MSQAHPHKKSDSELQDGVHKLEDDVTKLKGTLSGMAHDVASTATAAKAQAKRGLRQTIESSRKAAAQTVENVADTISDRPFISVAVAAGVGMLVGAWLMRSRK